MVESLAIVGGGGMGRCAADVIDAINAEKNGELPRYRIVGVVDDGAPDVELWKDRGVPFLGGFEALSSLPADVEVVLGIADPAVRSHLDEALLSAGRSSPVLVHPNVHRGHDVQLGPGAIVCSHVSMENHIRTGRHVHINQNATIGHDSVIDDYVTISPLTAVSGSVRLEARVFVGTGSSINQGLRVGAGAVVGAGAAVIRDVGLGQTVVGVPARPITGAEPG